MGVCRKIGANMPRRLKGFFDGIKMRAGCRFLKNGKDRWPFGLPLRWWLWWGDVDLRAHHASTFAMISNVHLFIFSCRIVDSTNHGPLCIIMKVSSNDICLILGCSDEGWGNNGHQTSCSEYLFRSCGVVDRFHRPKFFPLHGKSRSCQDVCLIKPVVEYILIHNHQFRTTSVYWYIYSESAIQLILVALNPSELWVTWSSFGSSLWIIILIICWNVSWQDSAVLYYLAFPNDWAYMKYLVYGIYILEFIQSALLMEYSFRIFVTSFGDVEAVDQVGTAWLSVPILTAIGELSCIRHGRLMF